MNDKKIIRNITTEEGKAFWDGAKKSAEGVKDWPAWKKGGIDVWQSGVPRDEENR